MKKKMIGAAAILFVISALAVMLYVLQEAPGASDDFDYSDVQVIYAVGGPDPLPVQEMEVTNAQGTYILDFVSAGSFSGDTFNIRGMEDLPVLATKLTTAGGSGGKIIARDIVAEGRENFPVFGLDKPSATVNVKYRDNGGTAQIRIGNAAPGTEGYYMAVSSDENIYLVSTANVSHFLHSALGFMDLVLTAGDPEEGTFNKATLGGAVREAPVIIEPITGESSQMVLTTHRITEPLKADLNPEAGYLAIISAFGLTAEEAVAVASDDSVLEEYGLKEPYSTIQITSSDPGNFRFMASKPDENGMVNLMTGKSKVIYSLHKSLLPWLEVQVYDLINRTAILPNIEKVSKVTVTTPSQSWVFEITGTEDSLSIKCGGQELPTKNFRIFYQTLLSAQFDIVPDEPLPEDSSPILTYKYEYRDGSSPNVISFFNGPPRRIYIKLDDNPEFLMASSYAEKVLEDIVKLLAGEEITIPS